VLLCVLVCGCAGYRMGTASLYPPDIRTVYVPMFESDSFRRNLGERLTEAVVNEIESKTPYKVVNSPNADSILTGRLTNETKRVLVEGPTREARELQMDFRVDVTWIDRKGDILQQPDSITLPTSLVGVGQTTNVVPEVGQSIATGQQQAIQRVAEQIVSLMEAPWPGEGISFPAGVSLAQISLPRIVCAIRACHRSARDRKRFG
jgi:hypothetical protein